MLGHITRHRHLQLTRAASEGTARASAPPRLRQRAPSILPPGWGKTPRATYYYDATWHTAQTLRRLIRANLAGDTLGGRPPAELLSQAMQALLHSICPGLVDDHQSQQCFNQLLRAHLTGLTPEEIAQLGELLKAQRFDCVVTESVIDDPMILKFGFANGPPHQRMRTLMFTQDLHDALDEVRQAASGDASNRTMPLLSPAQAADARDVLATTASSHTNDVDGARAANGANGAKGTNSTNAANGADSPGRVTGVTLDTLVGAATRLANILGLPSAPAMALTGSTLSPASRVEWHGDQLVIDTATFAALQQNGDPELYASTMRDLLELMLARRRHGDGTALQGLSASQRALLFREVEQVLRLPPTLTDPSAPARAAAILQRGASFGSVQICPTAGVQLGHAWIAPTLSLVPDRKRAGRDIGTRFMRSGLRLEPTQCTINEWDLRWLTEKENEDLYPADCAWQVRVPADRSRLKQGAAEIIQEWQRNALPYRFAGTAPGMPATGCRITVWQAAQRAMDDDTRALFTHFVRGLPAPDSPTELALRLEQFMDWLTVLAAQC